MRQELTPLGSDRDLELVSKSLQGSQLAFKELVERHHATAFAVVRGVMGDSDDVEDVVQMVYMKVYRNLDKFRGDSKFSTWLYQIARNEAINAVKKRRLDTTPVEDLIVAAPAKDGPEVALRHTVAADELERAMGRIDDRYREVLELRYMGERTYDEIAEVTGLPIGTVKTYIHRGKAALKNAMTRNLGRRDAAGAHE
jgi:RNA polymerase sigma-70 factor (ECF subfamily)